MIKNFINLEGHQNPFSGSKVTAILLKEWIWPIGGGSVGEGLPCSLHSRLVFTSDTQDFPVKRYLPGEEIAHPPKK